MHKYKAEYILITFFYRFTVCHVTHRGAAHEYDDEGFDDAADAHHPGHPEEQNHTQDVLQAGQVHTHQRPHPRSLQTHRGLLL